MESLPLVEIISHPRFDSNSFIKTKNALEIISVGSARKIHFSKEADGMKRDWSNYVSPTHQSVLLLSTAEILFSHENHKNPSLPDPNEGFAAIVLAVGQEMNNLYGSFLLNRLLFMSRGKWNGQHRRTLPLVHTPCLPPLFIKCLYTESNSLPEYRTVFQ